MLKQHLRGKGEGIFQVNAEVSEQKGTAGDGCTINPYFDLGSHRGVDGIIDVVKVLWIVNNTLVHLAY